MTKDESKSTPKLVVLRGHDITDTFFLETLLDVIISEYIQVSLVPGGRVESRPTRTNDGCESLCLKPVCHFQSGCPQNFGDFLSFARVDGHEMKPEAGFAWWARSRLRYSCSTIVAAFVRHIVPDMKNTGAVTELRTATGQIIQLDQLEIFSLGFVPNKTHSLVLKKSLFEAPRTEVIEALDGNPLHCSHDVLRCLKSGIIIDITIGEFLGTMKPYIFSNTKQLFSLIPGKILYFKKTSENHIDEQLTRDNAACRKEISPDSTPALFSKRVLQSMQDKKKDYCWNCKGTESITSVLKKCESTKALYCSKQCQILHWKTSKNCL
jgi:hypothetical protein